MTRFLRPTLYKTPKAKYTRNQRQRYQITRYKPFILGAAAPPRHLAAGRPREHGARGAAAGKGRQGDPWAYPLHGAHRPPAAGGCSAPWGAGHTAAPGGRRCPPSVQGHPGAAMREGRRFPRKRPREFRPPGGVRRKRRTRGRSRPAG